MSDVLRETLDNRSRPVLRSDGKAGPAAMAGAVGMREPSYAGTVVKGVHRRASHATKTAGSQVGDNGHPVRPVHHGLIGALDAGGAAVRFAGTHADELALKAVRSNYLRTS